jgi:hypothetical protein
MRNSDQTDARGYVIEHEFVRRIERFSLRLKHVSGNHVLLMALKLENVSIVKLLVKDIRTDRRVVVDNEGRTALHLA